MSLRWTSRACSMLNLGPSVTRSDDVYQPKRFFVKWKSRARFSRWAAGILLVGRCGHIPHKIRAGIRPGRCRSGRGTERLFANIRKCGVEPEQIKYLLITHCHYDHTGGAADLKKRLGLEIVAHELDAVYLETGDNRVTAANWYGAELEPFRVDRKLAGPRGDNSWRQENRSRPRPGALTGIGCVSHGVRRTGVVFAHDVHGPLDPGFLSNRGDYEKSLEMLLSIGADILCEGHYGVYRGRAR